MSVFEAVFLKVDGLNETEIEFRSLSAVLLDEASDEAMKMVAPKEANFIKILAGGHMVCKIGIDL